MSNTKKADSYRRLLKIMIVLLVLFVLTLVGYLLLDSYQKGQRSAQMQKLAEANNAMILEYNEKVLAQQAAQEPDVAPSWPEPKPTGIDIVELKGYAVKGAEAITVTRAEALKGGLLLVNRWHELPADFSIVEGDLVSIMDATERRVPVEARVMSLFPVAANSLDELIKAAGDEGLQNFLIREAYRSMQTQTEKWNDETAKYANRLSGTALVEKAREIASYPGTSDWQTGLSVNFSAYSSTDPVINKTPFNETQQSQWLYDNSWKFGWVLRFPVAGYPYSTTADKAYKTGISVRLNAYRYVGIPHALVMHEKDMVLEEYIEYLMRQKHLAIYEDGVLKYEIFRVEHPGTADAQLRIPAGATTYSVSTDNMGGLICAITY